MDADDVLPAHSGQKLRQAIAQHPRRDAAFWVTVEEMIPSPPGRPPRVVGHAHAKLFPRHPAIRFKYRVHEQVAPAIRELGLPIRHSGAIVNHAHADRSPLGEQARGERNLRLALLDLQERPDDSFVWLSLGTIYLFLPGGLTDALHFLRRSVAGLRRGSQNQLNAYLYLGQALRASGDRAQEEQVYRQALELFPDDSGLLLRLGGLCENAGRLAEAAVWYETIVERGQVRSASVHVLGSAARAALRLGEIYARTGQRHRAERLWREILERNPEAPEIREALAQSFAQACTINVEPM
jgi:Tfp pilus assembly protein PilF